MHNYNHGVVLQSWTMVMFLLLSGTSQLCWYFPFTLIVSMFSLFFSVYDSFFFYVSCLWLPNQFLNGQSPLWIQIHGSVPRVFSDLLLRWTSTINLLFWILRLPIPLIWPSLLSLNPTIIGLSPLGCSHASCLCRFNFLMILLTWPSSDLLPWNSSMLQLSSNPSDPTIIRLSTLDIPLIHISTISLSSYSVSLSAIGYFLITPFLHCLASPSWPLPLFPDWGSCSLSSGYFN